MNTQIAKLEKVKKSCKTAKNVTRVISILLLVAAILSFAGAAFVQLKGASIDHIIASNIDSITFSQPVSTGILQFDFNDQALLEAGEYATVMKAYCLMGGVFCIFAAIIFHALAKAFVIIEASESPFQAEVLKRLKRTFVGLTIVVGLFVGLGTCIMMALILWCIYCIMDYGMALQEEVDEIL